MAIELASIILVNRRRLFSFVALSINALHDSKVLSWDWPELILVPLRETSVSLTSRGEAGFVFSLTMQLPDESRPIMTPIGPGGSSTDKYRRGCIRENDAVVFCDYDFDDSLKIL